MYKKIKQLVKYNEPGQYIYHSIWLEPYKEKSPNVDHKREVYFVHIPKTAGTATKDMIGMDTDNISHATPTNTVHKKTWNKYFTFTIVRHPLDRLLSSYFYHTSEQYNGVYSEKFKDIESMTLRQYLYTLRTQTGALREQYKYIEHKYSNTSIDYVCKYENIYNDIEYVKKN